VVLPGQPGLATLVAVWRMAVTGGAWNSRALPSHQQCPSTLSRRPQEPRSAEAGHIGCLRCALVAGTEGRWFLGGNFTVIVRDKIFSAMRRANVAMSRIPSVHFNSGIQSSKGIALGSSSPVQRKSGFVVHLAHNAAMRLHARL
jgi:hypothetical protein